MAKKNSVEIDFGSLEADLRKYANNVCRNAASEIADELTKEALSAMGAFYSDYTPKQYNRHYYNFMNRSFRRYYKNPHNRIYKGGVEYTPGAMDNIYRGYSPMEVYISVVEQGSHGPYGLTIVPPMKESPMEMVLNKRDEIEKNIQSYINRAKSKAQKEGYTTLEFR